MISMMANRRLFDELMEGVAAMKAQREEKLKLRARRVKPKQLSKVSTPSNPALSAKEGE